MTRPPDPLALDDDNHDDTDASYSQGFGFGVAVGLIAAVAIIMWGSVVAWWCL